MYFLSSLAQELDFGHACTEDLSGSLFARTMQLSVGEGKYMLILNFYIDAALVDARYCMCVCAVQLTSTGMSLFAMFTQH